MIEKLALRWCEVKAQLGLGEHLAALLVRMLLHSLANPGDCLLQIGGSGEEVSWGHDMCAPSNSFRQQGN